ncbi:MerC domain-containing protein [Larkinella sp. VNQ87]|uniref:MerC domain-containing protein n=1 Tax=Larkinella sp. VNQ87 TaxID=3400921 RepID=UPI003BFC2852
MATSYSKADYIGITGSVLCIIHCLITPVLLISTTLLSDRTVRVGFLSLDYVFILVNIVAVFFASRQASQPLIRLGLWSFLALFAGALLLEDLNETFEYLAYGASAGLIVMHFLNLRSHRHTAH